MYANDTTLLLYTVPLDDLPVNSCIALDKAYEYFHRNYLVVNTDKTIHISFKRGQQKYHRYQMCQWTHTANFLGIIIDNYLSSSNHIDTLTKKLNLFLLSLKDINAYE